jgi:saccharopine dehydrogenase-like NADP-dependent oxidoreductase
MKRAVGLFALAVAALALVGCGDQGAAVFHNTVANGHNKIAVADKRFLKALDPWLKGKSDVNVEQVKTLREAYSATVTEADTTFQKAPVPDLDLARDLKQAYVDYLGASQSADKEYKEVVKSLENRKQDDKKAKVDVQQRLDTVREKKGPIAQNLMNVHKKFVNVLSLSTK